MTAPLPRPLALRTHQRGVTTLVVALSLLVILTLIILASSNVALFEQKTTLNENRQMMANQAAEYGLNLAGEYLKANVVNIASKEDDAGWLTEDGTNEHWVPCEASPADAEHPCWAEPDQNRRTQLYYWTDTGEPIDDAADAGLDIPVDDTFGGVAMAEVGGASAFPVTTRVFALLCRLDTTAGNLPSCQDEPQSGNRVAVTLVARSTMEDESAAAEIKETWATYNNFSAQASVPLVASGLVEGLGNATIVAAPNAGGYGLPASIWSPQNVDIDDGGGGVGSVESCHLGDYLQDTPTSELQTTCATVANACGCAGDGDSADFLSGHVGGDKIEGIDILDIDGGAGDNDLPDIEFFPGKKADGSCLDVATVDDDDNLFEWIFSENVNGVDGSGNPNATCNSDSIIADEDEVLANLGATIEADCSGLGPDSTGLIQVTGDCDLPNGDIGSPSGPVVLVVDDYVHLNNTNIFGMLFVRDSSGVGGGASIDGNGNAMVFGSVVVEGNVDMAGSITIVYVNTAAGSPGTKLPATTRFARLPGSWLDSRAGF